MSKSSTVTVREKPVEEVASAKTGGLTIHGETIVISTDERIELVDLTNRIMEFAKKFNIKEGLVSLWSMHTTCALFINEFQTALLTDIKKYTNLVLIVSIVAFLAGIGAVIGKRVLRRRPA